MAHRDNAYDFGGSWDLYGLLPVRWLAFEGHRLLRTVIIILTQ